MKFEMKVFFILLAIGAIVALGTLSVVAENIAYLIP